MPFCKKAVVKYFGMKEGSFYNVMKKAKKILKSHQEEHRKKQIKEKALSLIVSGIQKDSKSLEIILNNKKSIPEEEKEKKELSKKNQEHEHTQKLTGKKRKLENSSTNTFNFYPSKRNKLKQLKNKLNNLKKYTKENVLANIKGDLENKLQKTTNLKNNLKIKKYKIPDLNSILYKYENEENEEDTEEK